MLIHQQVRIAFSFCIARWWSTLYQSWQKGDSTQSWMSPLLPSSFFPLTWGEIEHYFDACNGPPDPDIVCKVGVKVGTHLHRHPLWLRHAQCKLVPGVWIQLCAIMFQHFYLFVVRNLKVDYNVHLVVLLEISKHSEYGLRQTSLGLTNTFAWWRLHSWSQTNSMWQISWLTQ